MKKISIIICVLVVTLGKVFAQNSINTYKYILVPKQYEFQKSPDNYQINSLTKFLFERAGFTTLYIDDLFPEDLALDRCSALTAIVKNNSGMLSTKLNIELVDCFNKTVFSTNEAKSKIKDYKKAFQDAIRKAFKDIEALDYKYSPEVILEEKSVTPIVTNIKKSVEQKELNIVEKDKVAEAIKELPKKEVLVEKEAKEPIDKLVITKKTDKKIISKPIVNVNEKVTQSIVKTIEGNYDVENWGKSKIVKKGDDYSFIGGDENFEFATIYKTSKPTIYIIKWLAFKQPQLLEINADGNLNVDMGNGKKVYKRITQ